MSDLVKVDKDAKLVEWLEENFSLHDVDMIFNTLDKSQDWTGSLVTDTFTCDNDNSYLICLDGSPTVNSTTLQKFDYDKLTSGKEYSVTLNGGVLGLFTKV